MASAGRKACGSRKGDGHGHQGLRPSFPKCRLHKERAGTPGLPTWAHTAPRCPGVECRMGRQAHLCPEPL